MAQGFHPLINPYGFDDIKPPKPDVEQAKKLLQEAGYPDGLDVEFMINPGRGRVEFVAQVVQQMAKPAGLRVIIKPVIGAQYQNLRRTYKYEMCRLALMKDDPIGHYYERLHTDKHYGGVAGTTGVKDPILDDLLDQFASEIDLEKRKTVFKKVLLRCNEQSYFIPYWQEVLTAVWSDRLKNFNPWNYAGWGEKALIETWVES